MEPYQCLVNAIIIQSVKDYRKAIRFLKHHPHTPDLDNDPEKKALRDKVIKKENERDAVERFFRSGWFEMLSSLDGEVLLKKVCEMEVG